MGDSSQIDEQVGALYGLRPGEFVAARDALAKRLRADGRREEAAAVKALPRPTLAAWAVNQLSRVEPEWTAALANAGRRLEEAQAALLERGDRRAWRDATTTQREAVDRLTALAERLLREERGAVGPALVRQVRQTLHAASVDAEARAAVCAGRLTRDLAATGGLGDRGGSGPPARRRPEPVRTPAEPAGEPPAGGAAEREARAARRTAEREARAELRRAERRVTAARAAAERAGKAAARARKAHDAAAAALADAQAAERTRAGELARAEAASRKADAALAEQQAAEAAARRALDDLRD